MLKIEFGGDGAVVLAGRLDAAQCPAAQAFLERVEGTVTLDCRGLEYISSAGLGVLLKTQKRLTASAGKLRLVGVIAVFALLNADADVTSGFRVAVRVVAVLCCLVQLRIQRPMDRAFQLRGTDYGSLWGPGLAVTIGGAVAEAFILVIIAGAL